MNSDPSDRTPTDRRRAPVWDVRIANVCFSLAAILGLVCLHECTTSSIHTYEPMSLCLAPILALGFASVGLWARRPS